MRFQRPVVSIDIESTGVNPVEDRIVEFAASVLMPDMTRKKYVQRFNPGIPIPAESTAIHGITDEMVADCPPFSDHAAEILRALSGKDLAGYNLLRMDLPMLDTEMRRCGLKLDIAGVRIIDCFQIFSKKEPRRLEDAVRRYCGREHTGAHGALADAEATVDILLGQMVEYDDLRAMNLDELAAFSAGDRKIADLAGKMYRDADGDLRYAFGKARDVKVKDDPGFAHWMLRCTSPPFPGSTVEILTAYMEEIGGL